MEGVRRTRLARLRPLRPADRGAALRPGHLRAGARARAGSVRGGRQPARALRARRPGDRLDAVPDQGPRVPELRDVRLLALHPSRAADAAGRRRARGRERRARGATASAWSGTSATGRRTGAGTRCATSPTFRSRSGRSRGARRARRPASPCYGSGHRPLSPQAPIRPTAVAGADELFAEIASLTDENRTVRDAARERRILQLRHRAGALLAGPRSPERTTPSRTSTGSRPQRLRRPGGAAAELTPGAAPGGDPARRLPADPRPGRPRAGAAPGRRDRARVPRRAERSASGAGAAEATTRCSSPAPSSTCYERAQVGQPTAGSGRPTRRS